MAIAHPVDLKAKLTQPGTQPITEQGVVFGQQNAHVGGDPGGACSRGASQH
jgi:hypothetical protein